jgi:exopolyphosphatase / guanosine-5'-triphosphate,3'-diphosphate pyrophosphatase
VKRIAVIDLGTNTFNLLIVDKSDSGFIEVFGTKVGVGLGLGGINQNRIQEDAIERALTTLLAYKSKCEEHKVVEIIAYGTSAIRNAENKQDFLNQVERATGIEIRVISGNREAELIYNGVNLGLEVNEPFLIMDIGGGSTEFILGDRNQFMEAASFEIGAARIFQSIPCSDPFTEEDCTKIESYLDAGVGDFFHQINVRMLIGASGSFETFYELLANKRYPAHTYVTLNLNDLMSILDSIIFSTRADREKDDRIIPIRKKMAPIAAVKIRWIIRKLGIQSVMISPYSLKEGVLSELIN